jgi:hypothetical protein
MASGVERTARGAAAGAIAAGIWAAQTPLDCRVFGVPYRDEELLGKAITRGRAWPVAGLAMHLANGAVFGAAFARIAPRMPLPPWARGPAAGLAEHLATWPLTLLVDRVHPARDELPRLTGSARAFMQATWRHVIFGAVLGELERRLNRPPAGRHVPEHPHGASGNGHGARSAAPAGTRVRPSYG